MSAEGTEVKSRRERLGMTIVELAKEAGVSRDTLSDLESGRKNFTQLTLAKIRGALDRLEHEIGIDAPPPGGEPRFIEFDVTGPSEDFHIVVKGPVEDADILKRQVVDIITAMRKAQKDDDTPGAG